MFRNVSLKLRLVLMIGGLVLAGIFLIGQIAGYFSRLQIEKDQGDLLSQIASTMATRLSQDLYTRSKELAFLTHLPQVRDSQTPPTELRRLLEQVKRDYPHYAWIGLTDAEGNIRVATGGLAEGKNVAKRDWFVDGREGLSYTDAHSAFLLAKLVPPPKYDDLPLRLVDISCHCATRTVT